MVSDQARYKLSATTTRTNGCGIVSGESDQLCSAAALHSGDKPSGPPMSKHLACNDRGEIIAFVLTGANVSDKDPTVFDMYGKLFADKGYISQKLFDSLFEEGIQLVTGLRVNMKNNNRC